MPERRYPTLDLLRVLAVAMTVLVHAPTVAGRIPLLRTVQPGFFLGVDLFMLISGWLLGGQLIKEWCRGTYSPRRFYFKRWMRTLPPYFATLMLVISIPSESLRMQPMWAILSHFFFLQGYLGTQQYGITWSLCVEEHFYLLLPLVVPVLIRRFSLRSTLLTLGLLSAAQVLGRLMAFVPGDSVPFISHLRCEGLLFGLVLAYISENYRDLWKRLGKVTIPSFALGTVASAVLMSTASDNNQPWKFSGLPTCGTLTLALVFIACVHEDSPISRLSFPGMAYAGELTYSIYLTHSLVPVLLPDGFVSSQSVEICLRILAVLVLAMLLHHVVERPFMRLRAYVLSGPAWTRSGRASQSAEGAK